MYLGIHKDTFKSCSLLEAHVIDCLKPRQGKSCTPLQTLMLPAVLMTRAPLRYGVSLAWDNTCPVRHKCTPP